MSKISGVEISKDEKVLEEIRYHPIMLLPVVISTVILVAFSGWGFYLIGRYSDIITQYMPLSAASLLLMGVLALALLIVPLTLYVYRESRLILTDENIIQVKQIGIFNRKVSALSLSHVEDVTGQSKGIIATVFGYGSIMVETAGEQENFTFTPVANPYPKVELINRVHQEFERKQGGGTAK